MEEYNDEGQYSVNFAEVAKSKDLLAVTRLLASDLTKNPYMHVGDWFKALSDSDLQTLLDVTEDEENPRYEDMILIAEMLASAEGLPATFTLEDVNYRIAQLTSFIAIESLYRKKLIKVFHENFSFGEDMGKKIVAAKLDD